MTLGDLSNLPFLNDPRCARLVTNLEIEHVREWWKWVGGSRVILADEVEKLAYQLNEEAERTERPIRRLSKVMYGSTCADMQVDVMGECLSSIKHVVGMTSGYFYLRWNHWEVGGNPSVTSVAAEFGIAHRIVSRLWRQFQTTGTAIREYSSGRPRGTTPADDRYIVLQARINRRQTAGEIARHTTQATGRPISRFTVARRLHGGGLFARRPARCVPLTPAHRRRRSLCGAGNTGIGETMNGDEYSLQMRADSV
ncbi:HTH_Tnp_Tc3_2 domain-containing protein [Trichonephila clavipes]|nr:HTH_Tnp_Tc3_2 domain-containing protein [Trichonephila clavipes]